jgi:ABC-type branched-subunit amino acid transport system substrate-binding protein
VRTKAFSGHTVPRLAAGLVLIATVLAACGSNGNGAASTGPTAASGGKSGSSTAGVTAKTITIGLDVSETGANAINYFGSYQGVIARVNQQNAEGGIYGRKIKLVVVDDQSNPVTAVTGVDSLMSKPVFSMIYNSAALTDSTAFSGPQSAGVPVVGAPLATNLWETQPYTNFVSDTGDNSPTPTADTYVLKEFQSLGVKSVAFLITSGCAVCAAGAQALAKVAPSYGIKVTYFNDTLPRGSVEVGPMVLSLGQSGAQAVYSEELDNTDFAIQETAKQNGYKFKAYYCSLDYTETLVTTPAASAAAQGCIASVNQEPISANTAATIKEASAFKKYEHFSGIPGLNWTSAWASADLTIQGLLAAGKNLTRAGFLKALHNLKGYNAEGLLPNVSDLSVANFGTAPTTACTYFVRYKGHQFKPLNGGKTVCGSVLKVAG